MFNCHLGIRGKSSNVMKVCSPVYIVLLFGCTIAIVFIGGLFVAGDYFCRWEQYGSLIAGIASLLNAVLLYVTLNHQDSSFNVERFETTFFNLLDQKRKLIEEFKLLCEEWDCKEHRVNRQLFQGCSCFPVICREMQLLRGNLFESLKYLGMLDYKTIDETVELECDRIHAEFNDDEGILRKMDDEFRQRLINTSYGISNELYQDVQKEKGRSEKELEICFIRFVNVKGLFLEHYFRYLKQIVVFIGQNQKDGNIDKDRTQYYIKILLSQMSSSEMKVIYYYALTNKSYCSLLKQWNLYNDIDNCINNKYYKI